MSNWVPLGDPANRYLSVVPKQGHNHAQGWNPIPVYMGEITQMVSLLPLVVQGRNEEARLVGLAGLTQKQNQLIGPKGGWGLMRIPAVLRLYPFRPLWSSEKKEYILALDRDSSLIMDTSQGTALYKADGELSDSVKQIKQQISQLVKGQKQLDQAVINLSSSGILQPLETADFDINFDVDLYTLPGLPALLQALKDRPGLGPLALAVAFALIYSRPNLHKLQKINDNQILKTQISDEELQNVLSVDRGTELESLFDFSAFESETG